MKTKTSEIIANYSEKMKSKFNFVLNMKTKVEPLVNKANEEALQSRLSKLTEKFGNCDPESIELLSTIEKAIEDKVTELNTTVEDKNNQRALALCEEISEMMDQKMTIKSKRAHIKKLITKPD